MIRCGVTVDFDNRLRLSLQITKPSHVIRLIKLLQDVIEKFPDTQIELPNLYQVKVKSSLEEPRSSSDESKTSVDELKTIIKDGVFLHNEAKQILSVDESRLFLEGSKRILIHLPLNNIIFGNQLIQNGNKIIQDLDMYDITIELHGRNKGKLDLDNLSETRLHKIHIHYDNREDEHYFIKHFKGICLAYPPPLTWSERKNIYESGSMLLVPENPNAWFRITLFRFICELHMFGLMDDLLADPRVMIKIASYGIIPVYLQYKHEHEKYNEHEI